MPLPELKIPAPVVLEEMTLAQLKTQLPGFSEDRVRTELIRKSLEYCNGNLALVRMKLHVGEPWPESSLCVLEFIDEEAQERFDFARFYVYHGAEIGHQAGAVPFDNLDDAMAYFLAEQNS